MMPDGSQLHVATRSATHGPGSQSGTPARRRALVTDAREVLAHQEAPGGRLESMNFAFGSDDVFAIADLPDNKTAAAVALTVSGSRHHRVSACVGRPELPGGAVARMEGVQHGASAGCDAGPATRADAPAGGRATFPAMRAYGFTAVGGPENETLLDLAPPVAGPGELLVRVRAAGVNPGDWKLRAGGYGAVPLPAVLGREVAGTVEAVGDGVHGFAVGDEVFGGTPGMVGGWAELARVLAPFAAHRPESVAPVDAAALPVAAGTALDGLDGLALEPGATLLVNGAGGGVGVAAVQLAVARGLTVVGTASPAKHDLLASLGAVPVAYGAGVVGRIRAAAPGGIDAAFDMVGGPALRTLAALVPDRTRLVSIADHALVAELGGHAVERDRSTAVLAWLAALVADGVLDPLVTDVRPLEEAGAALAAVEAGHARGKVAISVG